MAFDYFFLSVQYRGQFNNECVICCRVFFGNIGDVLWYISHFSHSLSLSSDNFLSSASSPLALAVSLFLFQLLLDRGARMERPHALTCSCSTCKRQMKEDSLRHSLLRIHCYRALASPAWLSLTSADPVLTAFRMSRELKILAMQVSGRSVFTYTCIHRHTLRTNTRTRSRMS